MARFEMLPYALFVGVSKYYAVSISYRDFLNLTKNSIAVKVTAIISAIGSAIHKYLVKDNVCNCTDDSRQHRNFSKPLHCYKRIHFRHKLNKYSADSIYAHIIGCIFNGVFACSECKEQIGILFIKTLLYIL